MTELDRQDAAMLECTTQTGMTSQDAFGIWMCMSQVNAATVYRFVGLNFALARVLLATLPHENC